MAADHGDGPALTGAALVEAAQFDLQLAESVVLVFDEGMLPARSRRRGARRRSHPFRATGTLADRVDIVVASGPGSPVAAVTVEFLAAFGVKRMVAVGTAGALTAAGERTRVVVKAVSDEGTSSHYSDNLAPHEGLTTALRTGMGAGEAVTLTTDAPFRHTPQRLQSHRAVADLVEMECAAIFSAARIFDVEAAALLVVSDVFGERDWTRADPTVTRSALADAVQAAAQVLTVNL